jgi:hypothetical protein
MKNAGIGFLNLKQAKMENEPNLNFQQEAIKPK